MFRSLSFEFSLENDIVDVVGTLLSNVGDGPSRTRSEHNGMLVQ